ncbi:unnamed protein product [Cuscuta europaea]|uniref:Uncharacterized protein n=1 Tax=Cuscuta europaea TaxID=41803 RepID=A0A9P0ZWV9_CUSEU|nr:unnamed protein product [Cuscuta europaea]
MMVSIGYAYELIGPEEYPNIILPLLREGSIRCSVKPASRITLHFNGHCISTFEEISWPPLRLERVHSFILPWPSPSASQTFHHLNTPTWVTSPRY